MQIKLGKAHLVISKSKIVFVLYTASHFFLIHLSAKVCSKNAWCAVTWHLDECKIHLTEYTIHLAIHMSAKYTWHLVISQSKACLSKVGATANYINGQPLPLSPYK